jgi:ABC-type polysaccharide/polyol phosphate transport system ATPase subunit
MDGFRKNGTTILLVTHDMGSIKSECTRAAWLEQGSVQALGAVDEIIKAYRSKVES